MYKIVLIGSPKAECVNCKEAIKRCQKFLETKNNSKFQIEVLMSNDPKAKKFGMISTPAIIVDNEVRSIGKAVSEKDIEDIFSSYDLA
jgi:protein-disulfide isomerase